MYNEFWVTIDMFDKRIYLKNPLFKSFSKCKYQLNGLSLLLFIHIGCIKCTFILWIVKSIANRKWENQNPTTGSTHKRSIQLNKNLEGRDQV